MMAPRHVEELDVRLSFNVEPALDGRALEGEQPLAAEMRVALEGAWIERAIGLAEPWTACRTSHFAADALELCLFSITFLSSMWKRQSATAGNIPQLPAVLRRA